MKSEAIKDGEWIAVPKKNFKMECCDCGLVHTINFEEDQKDSPYIFMQVKRSKHLTARKRKERNITYEKN